MTNITKIRMNKNWTEYIKTSAKKEWFDYTKALRCIPNDVTVKFSDGEFGIISSIAMVRSPVIARMLDGTFKEGVEKVINFPDEKTEIMRHLFNYIVFNGNSISMLEPEELVEVYIAADKYNILAMTSLARELLRKFIPTSKCLRVYASCNEMLVDIKKEAAEHLVDFMSGKHIEHICDICDTVLYAVVKCKTCNDDVSVYRGKRVKCRICSDKILIRNGFTCAIIREGKKCGNLMTERPLIMDTTGVPDDTYAEIFRTYVNVTKPQHPIDE